MAPHKVSVVITPFSVAFTQTVHGGYSCDQGVPRGPGEGTLWRLSKAHMPSLWGAPWPPGPHRPWAGGCWSPSSRGRRPCCWALAERVKGGQVSCVPCARPGSRAPPGPQSGVVTSRARAQSLERLSMAQQVALKSSGVTSLEGRLTGQRDRRGEDGVSDHKWQPGLGPGETGQPRRPAGPGVGQEPELTASRWGLGQVPDWRGGAPWEDGKAGLSQRGSGAHGAPLVLRDPPPALGGGARGPEA